MLKRSSICGNTLLVLCVWCAILISNSSSGAVNAEVLKREERRTLVSTEYVEISAARVSDNINGSYLLHFFTLEPNSLLLPVILHADMVFYVHTGSGKLSWTEEDDLKSADLRRGDVYRVEEGSVFFLESNLETERQKLRINALFANSNNGLNEPVTGPYSSIRDMLLGFDRRVLQAAFNVPDEVMDEMLNGTKPPAIVHGLQKSKRTNSWHLEEARGLLRSYNILESNKKKKKSSAKLFNLFKESKDFENCNGWSTAVTRKKLSALKGSDIGLFMVNLTSGSMMGPHWNPKAAEVAVVLQGRGMVRVVCPSISNETGCTNTRFEVVEGDVFAVPRFHPMAQMSFNNDTLVFMGFSSSAKRNHPQFLAGQASVFRTLDKDVLALSFNVSNTTLDQLVGQQRESVILGCVSCAEEELRLLEEELERERQEAKAREEEAERKREEERRKEEEEARKREEEAAKKEEEEERQRREEEEAAAKRREEEEERKRQEEEEERKRQEEEARQREEEEARQKREEEEAEARRREEEAARKEEEERQRREEEEAAARRRQEKQRQREEEEAAARKREEEEAARQEEEERQRREEEEAAARREEKHRQRQEEEAEARRREEERQRQREAEEAEARRAEEEQRQREAEEAEARRREEEEQREQEEEEGTRRHREGEGRSEGERAAEEERRREEEAQWEEERGGGGGERIINLKKRLTV